MKTKELTDKQREIILSMDDKDICSRINSGLNGHEKEWNFAVEIAKQRGIYFMKTEKLSTLTEKTL
jgi:hypothetical protein